MEFEFDPIKSLANAAKHGIDFIAAQALWLDPLLLVIRAKTTDEPRWIATGMIDGTHWTAIYTDRDGTTRLISVRRSRVEERQDYEADARKA